MGKTGETITIICIASLTFFILTGGTTNGNRGSRGDGAGDNTRQVAVSIGGDASVQGDGYHSNYYTNHCPTCGQAVPN
jgi:hypothetical protein